MKWWQRYPKAFDPAMVGKYPANTKSGGGYFWDEVLEYRVWCHPELGAPDHGEGDDYFYAFPDFRTANSFSKRTEGAEPPLALVLQREHINEPEPEIFEHVTIDRITEWKTKWLSGSRRTKNSISDFLARFE
ncbi:MAG: hypothetical protein ABJM58_02640 [Alteripontixanthobacter sp.]